MNEVIEKMLERRSIRNFKPDMVPNELIEEIVKCGTFAPTGRGAQSPIIIAVTNKEVRDRLSKENAAAWGKDVDPFYGAPVVLLVLADKQYGTYLYDGSCVIDNMLNAAWSLGLGSIWIHRAKQVAASEYGQELLKSLGITGDYEGIGFCCIGYINGENPTPKPRKDHYVYYVK